MYNACCSYMCTYYKFYYETFNHSGGSLSLHMIINNKYIVAINIYIKCKNILKEHFCD